MLIQMTNRRIKNTHTNVPRSAMDPLCDEIAGTTAASTCMAIAKAYIKIKRICKQFPVLSQY
jgi:hypothetical protein